MMFLHLPAIAVSCMALATVTVLAAPLLHLHSDGTPQIVAPGFPGFARRALAPSSVLDGSTQLAAKASGVPLQPGSAQCTGNDTELVLQSVDVAGLQFGNEGDVGRRGVEMTESRDTGGRRGDGCADGHSALRRLDPSAFLVDEE